MDEAEIIVNGVRLSVGQSMTVRCALTEFLGAAKDLGDDENGRAMSEAYAMRSREVLRLITAPSTDGGEG